MQVAALQQNDLLSKRFVYYFAAFWSVTAALYIAFITFGDIPESNVRFADTILGFILGTVIATIIQFFFGSSVGSKEKHNTLEALVKK
jgi:predicted permease